MPLPLLDEQCRLLTRIGQVQHHLREATQLRTETDAERQNAMIGLAHRRDLSDFEKMTAGWRRMPLGRCLRLSIHTETVRTDAGYPNFGIYSFGRGLFPKPPIEGFQTSAATLQRVRAGQFVYSRLFAFEGAYGVVTAEHDGWYVSNEYPTFDCDPEVLRVETLRWYFTSPTVWKEVAVGSKGLGDRRQRVQPRQILDHQMWIPPLSYQHRLAEIGIEIERLRRLQTESAAEINALLPAVLHRAFNGEL